MAKQERKLNKRFVTVLTIVVMVILTVFIGIMVTVTSRKDPQIYAERGDKFMEVGEYTEAAKNYGNAFRYSKKNPKWMVKIAEAQYQGGDERKAIGSLKVAVRAVPGTGPAPWQIPAQKRLMEIYFELIGRNASPSVMKTMEEEADRLIRMIPEKSAEKDPELKKALALGYHCRGVARFGRRTENANLVKLAAEDINKAIALDKETDYVVSKAAIILEGAQEMLQAARTEDISPESYVEFIGKMRQQIGKAEELYLTLGKGSKTDSEALVTRGNFYFQICGGTEKALGQYCRNMAEKLSGNILRADQQLAGLAKEKNVSAEEKRRIRQKTAGQISQWKREKPQWFDPEIKETLAGQHDKLAKEYYEKALTLYKEAVNAAVTKDQRVTSQTMLANYYLVNDNLAEAEKIGREAVKTDPNGLVAYRILSEILKQSAERGDEKQRQAMRAESINILVKRIYDIPTNVEGVKGRQNKILRLELMARLVDLYLDRNKDNDLKKADDVLSELGTSEMGEIPALYLLRARRALVSKDAISAIKLLEKADKLSDGRNPQVKFALAELYANRGELGAAKKTVMSGLAVDPNSVNGWRLASTILLQTGDPEGALGYAERILSTQKEDKGALALKLECLARLNRLSDADTIAKQINAQGEKFNWKIRKAQLLLERGNLVEAESHLRQILSEKPGDRAASIYLVEVYFKLNKKEKISGLIKTALEKSPGDKGLLRLQKLTAISDPQKQVERMKEVAREVNDENMRQALTQAQEEKDPYARAVRLADQYLRRNETEKAKTYLDEAMKLNPRQATPLNFKFSLITKDWDRARKGADFAVKENLDSMKGQVYEAELANARGWEFMMKAQKAQDAKDAEEAKKYMEQGKTCFEQSARAAEQIITDLPNDSQARALLGEAYLWLDRRNEADTHISKGLELSPDNSYALRAASLREWSEIGAKGNLVSREVVQAFADHVRKAYQLMPWDEWLKGRATWLNQQVEKQREYQEETTGDAGKAVAKREKRRKDNPGDGENLVRLAWLFENREAVRDLDKAEECYQQALERNPSRDLVRVYLEFAGRNKRLEGMEKFLADLAARQAKSGKGLGYSTLGYFYMAVGSAKKSEQAFLDAVKAEDGAEKRLDLAVFYAQIKNTEQTAEWCQKALTAKPTAQQEKSARNLLINTLLLMNQWDQAKTQIEIYQKQVAGSEGKFFEVQLAIGQGQTGEAERLLAGMLEKNPEDMDILGRRAMVYLYSWQLEKARADMEKINKVNPNGLSVDGRIKLVKLECEMGRVTDAERGARELITQAVNQPPGWNDQIRVDLLPSLGSILPEKNYEELLTWAGTLTQDYWGWSFAKGQLLQSKEKYDQAAQAFRQSWDTVESDPKAPAGLKLMILDSYLDVLYRQAEYQKVIRTVERTLSRLPKNPSRVLSWQAAAYYAEGQKKKGLDLFLTALDDVEKNPLSVWQMTRDTILKTAKGPDLVDALEKSVLSSRKDKMGKEVALAGSYFAADQIEKGAALYRKLVAETQDPGARMVILFTLAQEYSEKHKYMEAANVLTEADKYSSGNPAISNNLAYILEENLNKPQDALKLIEKAYQKDPNNADLLDTYGQILSKIGRTNEGVYHLAESVWARASAANRYHLGMALLKQNRASDAETQFRQALQMVGSDKDLEKQIREALNKK